MKELTFPLELLGESKYKRLSGRERKCPECGSKLTRRFKMYDPSGETKDWHWMKRCTNKKCSFEMYKTGWWTDHSQYIDC